MTRPEHYNEFLYFSSPIFVSFFEQFSCGSRRLLIIGTVSFLGRVNKPFGLAAVV